MKKVVFLLAVLFAVGSLGLAGCGKKEAAADSECVKACTTSIEQAKKAAEKLTDENAKKEALKAADAAKGQCEKACEAAAKAKK